MYSVIKSGTDENRINQQLSEDITVIIYHHLGKSIARSWLPDIFLDAKDMEEGGFQY